MDTKILPVAPENKETIQPTELTQWKEKAVARYRIARASREGNDVWLCICSMTEGYKIKPPIRDEPLFREIAGFLKSYAAALPSPDKKAEQNSLLLGGAGDVLAEIGDFAFAHECFDKAIRLTPNDEDAYMGKAWAYLGAGDREKAIEYFEKTLAVNPARIRAIAVLGMLCRITHKFGKAKKYYEQYLLFSSDDEQEEKERRTVARKWLPCLTRKIELFGEELRYS
jgi:tetratricopeptide (TPR) repeat protein